jgi:hypothetical protein
VVLCCHRDGNAAGRGDDDVSQETMKVPPHEDDASATSEHLDSDRTPPRLARIKRFIVEFFGGGNER